MLARRFQSPRVAAALCAGLGFVVCASVANAGSLRLDFRTNVSSAAPAFSWVLPQPGESASAFWARVNFVGQGFATIADNSGGTAHNDSLFPSNLPNAGTTNAGQNSADDGGYSLAVIQWPIGNVPPPLNLGEPGVFGTTAPAFPGSEFAGTTGNNGQFAFPPAHSEGDNGPDPNPGVTPVPLPAAAWSGLAALPVVLGAGWARRRRQRSA